MSRSQNPIIIVSIIAGCVLLIAAGVIYAWTSQSPGQDRDSTRAETFLLDPHGDTVFVNRPILTATGFTYGQQLDYDQEAALVEEINDRLDAGFPIFEAERQVRFNRENPDYASIYLVDGDGNVITMLDQAVRATASPDSE